jgi:hypothetical protein
MALPANLHFSQASLQDYVDCRRRFQLRYLLRLAWPALESEPALENERRLRAGERFHRMVQQHLIGVPAERLSATVAVEAGGETADLAGWWANYLEYVPRLIDFKQPQDEAGPRFYPEVTFTAQLGSYSLVSKCDLVAVQPDGSAQIYDWKTSRLRPKRLWLERRLQTRVYPYLLVRAGAHLNGGRPFLPERVEMIYWFAGFPMKPERFDYSRERYQSAENYLQGMVAEIEALEPQAFDLTENRDACQFCVYRSLCDRGVQAGDLSSAEAQAVGEESGLDPLELELDFDQIAEIEF